MTEDPRQTARERLAAIIARQDAERGRPLTAQEQLDNLAAALLDVPEEPCQHEWDFKSNLHMWGCTKCGVHREAHTRG